MPAKPARDRPPVAQPGIGRSSASADGGDVPQAARSESRTVQAPAIVPRAERTPTTPQKDDKRKQILKAAVKVFAEKGYHGCRISDVAEEAGVAYGLVYHYYGNKDGLLASVFDTNWAVFAKAVNDVADTAGLSMFEKLSQIVELAFQAFELFPLVVKVLVLEFGRNARLGETLESPAVAEVLGSIARIFEDGRRSGELFEGIDPYAMSVIFMGTLETAFVSFVLTSGGARSKMQSNVTLDKMKSTLLAMTKRGLLGHTVKKS
jgi:TetR/AcrR family fatty acid metabolism transcriptional regulator